MTLPDSAAHPMTPTAPSSAPPAPTGHPVGYAPVPSSAPRGRSSVAGTISLIGAAVLTFLYVVVKVLGAALNGDPDSFDPSTPPGVAATVLGVFGLLAVVPVALVIVLGHLGVRRRPDGSNAGRIVAAVGLGAGYVHLVAWFTRLIVALVLLSQSGDVSLFLSNIFWWA